MQHSGMLTLVFSRAYRGNNLEEIIASSAGSMAVLQKKKDYVSDPVLVTNRSFTRIRFDLPFIRKKTNKTTKNAPKPINQPKIQIKK